MTCIVYGYGQASYDPLVPSTEDQEAFARQACRARINTGVLPPDSVWSGFVRDEATQKPMKFRQRQAASFLVAGLRSGNVLIAASHDRIFSGVIDAVQTFKLAAQIGFRVIVPDFDVDSGVPSHLPMLAMIESLRNLESRRTKEEFEYRKRQGMPAGGKVPIGWAIVRAYANGSDCAYFVEDPVARRVAQSIVEHHDGLGLPFEKTADWFNGRKRFRPGGRRWRRTAIFNWYHAAKDGFPLPNGRREAFPIPVDALPSQRCRTISADDE